MELKRITITISEEDDLTDAQLDELLDLINERLDQIGFKWNLLRVLEKAKLSHGVKVEVNY